ncbi:MAG TPA: CocE/NonD family hydrolase [Planctomycetes bacterium]|nr:CocE/NonD family hydrolase [Planctomycetota bacterium]
MKKLAFCVAVVAVLFVSCLPEHAGQKKGPHFEVQRFENVRVPMADGVELSANISRPKAEGEFPVVLVRTPYGKGNGEDDDGGYFAKSGCAYVIQDCRGTGQSAGAWEPGLNEKADGLDTHKWILAQDWCDGKIATAGGSYLGFTQWIVAPDTDDRHKAMFTLVPLMNWHQIAYIGGAFGLGTNMGWGSEMLKPTEGEGSGLPNDWDIDKAYRYLPLSAWDEQLGFKVQFMRDWIAHPEFDSYWARAGIAGKADQITVPSVTLSGWYDVFIGQVFEYVKAVRETSKSDIARQHSHLIVGPWAHGPNWVAGERDFGENTEVDVEELQNRWFGYWLKGKGTVDDLPPYRIFVMGTNQWRDEYEWPLAQTQYTPYYFHSEGNANTLSGDGSLSTIKPQSEPVDKYVYDPENPVPTRGGCILFGDQFGAQDQTEIEKRKDVLVFTSKELTEALEVTGPVKVVLYAASDAPDTDWTAKLVDVYPDGKAFNLCDGIIRARHRESATNPTLIEPNRIYRYEIDLWVTSNVFLPGHRIRVEISSSNFPRFDRNPNTGHKFGADAELKKAMQTIYHDADQPSHILLPVIPSGAQRK